MTRRGRIWASSEIILLFSPIECTSAKIFIHSETRQKEHENLKLTIFNLFFLFMLFPVFHVAFPCSMLTFILVLFIFSVFPLILTLDSLFLAMQSSFSLFYIYFLSLIVLSSHAFTSPAFSLSVLLLCYCSISDNIYLSFLPSCHIMTFSLYNCLFPVKRLTFSHVLLTSIL